VSEALPPRADWHTVDESGSWSLYGSAANVSRLVINLALGDPTQKWGVGVRWGWRHGKLHATGACGAGEWLNVEPALSHNRAVGQQSIGCRLTTM
jgi:hypothetical protein